MTPTRRELTLEEEAEVGKLMVEFLDRQATGQEICEEDLLDRCSSSAVAADLRERLVDCRGFLRLREIFTEVEVGEAP